MSNLADIKLKLAKHSPKIYDYIEKWVKIMNPLEIYLCDGSEKEVSTLKALLCKEGMMKKVPKLDDCWHVATDPKDVARVESATVICHENERTTIPKAKDGVKGKLGFWKSPENLQKDIDERFPNCMTGRTMYVIPFSMGTVGGPLSKSAVQLTDSAYVVCSMHIMTRISLECLEVISDKQNGQFVKCTHSVGVPLPLTKPLINNWPCNPEKLIVGHLPEKQEIVSFGSGYGGNSLLGKKCFALRIGSNLAKQEGWLAEHMLIASVTNPKGQKKYIAGAFPSSCGKTNLCMMEPTLPGWKVECIGDDIAWLRFDEKTGRLRAINPEAGFFGVAPGTNMETNPNAMKSCMKGTVFTNVATTSDGNVYWEGGDEIDEERIEVTTWLNRKWKGKQSGEKAAHPNSRFCTPAKNCPVISPDWEDPEGVPIDAIIFGGRRPEPGIPLVYQSYSWKHGVMIGASMRSETTAASNEMAGKKVVLNDPFAMRPFFGYNFGDYLKHWLSMENQETNRQMPEIFHVNWFRKDPETGKFLWPGFGDNIRVLEWIFDRCESNSNTDNSIETPIGYCPKKLNLMGLKNFSDEDWKALFELPVEFWKSEMANFKKYLEEQVGEDVPAAIWQEIEKVEMRFVTK